MGWRREWQNNGSPNENESSVDVRSSSRRYFIMDHHVSSEEKVEFLTIVRACLMVGVLG